MDTLFLFLEAYRCPFDWHACIRWSRM